MGVGARAAGDVQRRKKGRLQQQQQQQGARVLMPPAAAVGAQGVAAAGSSDEQVVPSLFQGGVDDAAGLATEGDLHRQQQQQQRRHVHKHQHGKQQQLRQHVRSDDAAMDDAGDVDEFRPRAYHEMSDSWGARPVASLSTACSKFERQPGGGLQQQQQQQQVEDEEEGFGDVEMEGPVGGGGVGGDGLLLVQEAARLHIAQAGGQ
jgi:hypothetical protein